MNSIETLPNLSRARDQADIADFRDWLAAKGLSAKTLRTYLESVESLSTFLSYRGMPLLEAATREHLEAWLRWLHEKGNKPATVRNRFAGVQQFYNWMQHADVRQDHPMVRIAAPKVPEQVQPDYSPAQIKKLFDTISLKDKMGLRDRALVALLYDTGIRCEESCQIRIGDVSREARRVIIPTGKGGKGRIVGYGPETADLLNRYLRKRGGWTVVAPEAPLFEAKDHAALTTNAVRMLMQRRFRDAGIEFRGTHAFRRSWAQMFLDAGGDPMDLQELAGWSSPSMVYRYTKRTAQERALRASDRFSPMSRLGRNA